ncbi:MAG: acylphosphatase [Candidatus Eiseniibacteriota bacterium]|nr:MAG: acylphosphatase [Candidatus Eisenbacteria bacterium]
MEKAGARIVVSGIVQGVGYRFFALRQGDALGLKGYVRNAPDGTVEARVEGERQAIEDFVSRLKEGPRASRVTDVRVKWTQHEGQFRSLEVSF